ncbi:phosphonate metabolism transcriptional regulator PhnF [Neptunicoccus cionae]|uniref:Phosphonate metabolism transcriptional regulator PhnF n=1 Tax=Neptunicoccus cionae TaxID=2035344 RepID=A0A916QY15_9RHOB|nr:phosphonate metabolism transcriptional regulator PhnF [Amylibacter cionae]GGA17209.1 phosphonate metabolism transcriptional regulator PhnF [Amylibacter cionae]
MAKQAIWKDIAERITRDIAKGHHKAGEKLPTEVAYGTRFGVNRHTVRHAISALVEEGLVYTRRGAGAFVAADPVRYSVGKRVRFHQSVAEAGHQGSKELLSMTTRPADAEEARALGRRKGVQVHVVEGLARVDETPVAHFISVFPAARFPDLLAHLQTLNSITAAFAACGVQDYTRQETRLAAVNANATSATLLNLKVGTALLRSTNVDVDLDGQPVEYGRTWFSGNHIELTIDGSDTNI